MDGIKVDEYYVIRKLNGVSYKLYNVIKLMTKQSKVDENNYVELSYAKIRNKLGMGNNIVRIVDDLEKHPEIIEVVRGNTKVPNKFKITNPELLI